MHKSNQIFIHKDIESKETKKNEIKAIDMFFNFIKKCVMCTMSVCTLGVLGYAAYFFLGGNGKFFFKEKQLTQEQKMQIAKDLIKEREVDQHLIAAKAVGETLGLAKANDFEARVNDAAKARLNSAVDFAKKESCKINENNCELVQSYEEDIQNAPLPKPSNFGIVKPSQFAHAGNTAKLPRAVEEFKPKKIVKMPVSTFLGEKIANKPYKAKSIQINHNNGFDEIAMRSAINKR
jgi:hypothetical protein